MRDPRPRIRPAGLRRPRWREAVLGVLLFGLTAAARAATPPTTDAQAIAALNLDAPGLEAVKAAAAANDLAGVQNAYLAYRRTQSQDHWTTSPSQEPTHAVEATDAVGDQLIAHTVPNLYGTYGYPASVNMGADFNWTYNPLPTSNPSFTYEWTWCNISRAQFWDKLADAYWKTLNEKYVREWVAELNDFAVKNPVDQAGANGAVSLWRTLDAAIRVADSMCDAYYHFIKSPSFTSSAMWLYLKLMCDHATLLYNGLQDPNRTGNWVTMECNALYTIGILFPELKNASMWRNFALARLQTEFDRMVPPDGFEAELTPNYHTVALIGFQGPLILARLNQTTVPSDFQTRILSMYRALVNTMDQAGNVTPTNDSQIISAVSWAKTGLQFGDDPLLKWATSGGTQGTAPPTSMVLPYAGFYVMRGGWDLNDTFLFFRAGPEGIGHDHEDMLEVVLRAWNQTLLFDPGTYSYDLSDWRRFALGTFSHSTIVVDGKWQHRPENTVPVTQAVTNPWESHRLFDYTEGTFAGGYQANTYNPSPSHEGYPLTWTGTLDKSVSHTRRVLFLKPYYALILDTLDGTGSHQFDAHFHLYGQAAAVDSSSQAAFSANTGTAQLALYPLDRDHLTAEVIQGQTNPLLGWMPVEHRAIPTVRFRKTQNAPAIFSTFLYPYQGSKPTFSATPLAVTGTGMWSRTLATDHERIDVVISTGGAAQTMSFTSALAGAVAARAAGVVIRQSTGVVNYTLGGWDMSWLQTPDVHVSFSTPASILVFKNAGRLYLFNAGAQSVAATSVGSRISGTLPSQVWVEWTGSAFAPASGAPAVNILQPALGGAVSGQVTVKATVADTDSSVVDVQFSLDRQPAVEALGLGPYEYVWDTGSGVLGPHTVTVTAVDQNHHSYTASAVYTVVSPSSANAVAGVEGSPRVYPNPWRRGRSPIDGVTFDSMMPGATVEIFTVSGRLSARLTADAQGRAIWSMKTSSGDEAASGVYLYLVQDGQGHRFKGSVGVIR